MLFITYLIHTKSRFQEGTCLHLLKCSCFYLLGKEKDSLQPASCMAPIVILSQQSVYPKEYVFLYIYLDISFY